jgi:ubiquinone/menaquinone biosynthesis C-methylase UbiE
MTQESFYKKYGGNAPENYEQFFVPRIGRPLAVDLIEVAALRSGERVLDVACGTGIVARLAAERVGKTGKVAALDLNPGMLAVAKSVAPSDFPIDWYESTAESMPLNDEAFDVVMCQLGLMFIPDKSAALHEMRRVLAPRGRLIINTPGPIPRIFRIMEESLERHIEEAGRFVSAVFSLHDPAQIEQLIKEAGFQNVVVRPQIKKLRLPEPKEFLWQYIYSTPLMGAMAEVTDETRSALERDVVAKWQEFVDDGSMVYEQRIVVSTAIK